MDNMDNYGVHLSEEILDMHMTLLGMYFSEVPMDLDRKLLKRLALIGNIVSFEPLWDFFSPPPPDLEIHMKYGTNLEIHLKYGTPRNH